MSAKEARTLYRKILLGDPCSYCGRESGTADHIVPRIRGGSDAPWNLTAACGPCNRLKAEQPLLGFLVRTVTR